MGKETGLLGPKKHKGRASCELGGPVYVMGYMKISSHRFALLSQLRQLLFERACRDEWRRWAQSAPPELAEARCWSLNSDCQARQRA
jgi:hypothetical protein